MKTIAILFASSAGLATLIASAASAGAVLDEIEKTKVLTVATNSDYPPQAFLNAENELDGFDIEVSREVAKRMGAKANFVTPGWEVMTSGRWANRWQIAVASITPTGKRAEVLDFPAIYYYSPAIFAVHRDSKAKDVGDLNDKVIGVVSASTYESYLKHNLKIDAIGTPSFEYQVTPAAVKSTEADEIDELALGDGIRLDGVLQAQPRIEAAIKKGQPIRLLGKPVFYEPLAIAADKGDAELNAKLVQIISDMRSDGTMKALSEKWYGTDYSTAK
ncbi:transporter substrate-binding domain-containing protein [Rhizobium sp. RAF56]|uniref:transporter substrate-binding domain-containing protein n=1 Tax=Rhizobium sp. RAF56 TaxID=3233062 RepID=UPI003F9C5841